MVYHLAVGLAALVGAVLTRDFVALAAVLALFSAFMISRPFHIAVVVDHDAVTLKGMFSSESIELPTVTAVEVKKTGKGNLLILWGDLDLKNNLTIPDLFAFDDDWDSWWNSHRDLSDSKPLSLF